MDFETAAAIERFNEIADVRAHVVILNEATRDDIRLVADAVAALAVKVDAIQR